MSQLRGLIFWLYRLCVRLLWNTGIGNKWPFNQIHYRIVARLRPDEVVVDGHRIRLDATDSCRLSYADIHRCELEFLRDRIKPGDVVVDVGANIGFYTLWFARQVGPQGKVFAFEPEPENFKLLVHNVEVNGYSNVTCESKAVVANSGSISLHLSKSHAGTHRVFDSSECGDAIQVAAVSLDDYFGESGNRVDLLKLDIEGAEPQALAGMRNLIQRNPGVRIFCEVYPAALLEAGSSVAAMLDLLQELGFQILQFNSRLNRLVHAELDTILAECPVNGNLVTNLWCEPSGARAPFATAIDFGPMPAAVGVDPRA